jgi:hypothetical protein
MDAKKIDPGIRNHRIRHPSKNENSTPNPDELAKSPKDLLSVIPAKAGIQSFQGIIKSLDSGFHRSDDFLRGHQPWRLLSFSVDHFIYLL